MPKEKIEFEIQNKIIKSEKQIRTLNFLKNNDGIYIKDLENFTDVSNSIIKTLEKNNYIEIRQEKIERNPFQNNKIERDLKKELNDKQKECFEKISESIEQEKYTNNLIFGITGSRKNRNIFAID